VAERHIAAFSAPIAGIAEARLRGGDDVLSPEKLTRAVELSLSRALFILELDIDPQHKNALKIMQLQKEVLATVLSTQARVSSDKLRSTETDKMAELLERIRQRRAV